MQVQGVLASQITSAQPRASLRVPQMGFSSALRGVCLILLRHDGIFLGPTFVVLQGSRSSRLCKLQDCARFPNY